jgi:hypothetical protein
MPTLWTPSSPDTVAAGLEAWIEALRARLIHGQLRNLESVAVSDDKKLPAELAARLVLNDLDHFDDLPLSWGDDPFKVARRRHLLHDLQDLRRQLG